MSEGLKKKLSGLESDLRSLREERATKDKAREAAKEAYGEIPEGEDTAEAFHTLKETVRSHGEVADQIDLLAEERDVVLKAMGDREATQRTEQLTPSATDGEWATAHLLGNQDIRTRLEVASSTKARFGSVEIGQVIDRDAFAADIAPTNNMRRGASRGLLPQSQRPLRILDLIPTGTTDGNSVPYTVESGAFTGPVEVAEGGTKPEAGVTYTDADAPVQTIAAWMKIRKQALADFAALRSIIDQRLRYAVERRLEGQVLAGTGSGSNLTGILNTSGIGTVPYSATVSTTELILSGVTNIYLADGVADGIAMHPADWQIALTERAHNGANTVGSYEYLGGGPFGTTPQTLWGVPCTPSAAVPAGNVLVADFGLGCQLLIREGVNVLFSDSDQDDFIKNRVTMLGELRAALAVWRPSVFQNVDISA